MTPNKEDKEGRKVAWFNMNRYYKSDATKMIKEFTVWQFEMLDKKVKKEGWTIVVDISNAGLANVDLEWLLFNIETLQSYYPLGPKYLLAVNLPLVLEATMRIIINFSNDDMKKRLKVTAKEEMPDYFKLEDIPDHLKGTSDNNLLGQIGNILG